MKVTIKGLTASTIVLNNIGIIIRGDSSKSHTGSCAYHIDIDNEHKLSELNSLVNSGLVTYIVEEDDSKLTGDIISTFKDKIVPVEEIFKDNKENEDIVEDKKEEKILKPKGRPKGSVNKSTKDKIKKISRVEQEEFSNSEDVIFMTEKGPSKGKMNKNESQELDYDRTKASLDAMEQLEKEENESTEFKIDEDSLDESEKMGSKAVISCGGKDSKSVTMSNSIVPEADAIKNKGIKFIDSDSNDEILDDSIFIEQNNDDDLDFLEY
jgi:hypothetical protein